MELLLVCAAMGIVIVAFAVADYLDAKAKALLSASHPSTETHREDE